MFSSDTQCIVERYTKQPGPGPQRYLGICILQEDSVVMLKLEACMLSPKQQPQYSVQSHSFSIGKISQQFFILKAYGKTQTKLNILSALLQRNLQESNIPASKQTSN